MTPKALLLNSTQYSPAWWDFSMGRITKCLYISINLLSSFLHQVQFRSAEKESCHQDNCSYWPRTPALGLQRDKVHSFFQKWKENNAIDMKTGFLSVPTPLFSLSCVYACMCVRAWGGGREGGLVYMISTLLLSYFLNLFFHFFFWDMVSLSCPQVWLEAVILTSASWEAECSSVLPHLILFILNYSLRPGTAFDPAHTLTTDSST